MEDQGKKLEDRQADMLQRVRQIAVIAEGALSAIARIRSQVP